MCRIRARTVEGHLNVKMVRDKRQENPASSVGVVFAFLIASMVIPQTARLHPRG
jgi:hypothetical protein